MLYYRNKACDFNSGSICLCLRQIAGGFIVVEDTWMREFQRVSLVWLTYTFRIMTHIPIRRTYFPQLHEQTGYAWLFTFFSVFSERKRGDYSRSLPKNIKADC